MKKLLLIVSLLSSTLLLCSCNKNTDNIDNGFDIVENQKPIETENESDIPKDNINGGPDIDIKYYNVNESDVQQIKDNIESDEYRDTVYFGMSKDWRPNDEVRKKYDLQKNIFYAENLDDFYYGTAVVKKILDDYGFILEKSCFNKKDKNGNYSYSLYFWGNTTLFLTNQNMRTENYTAGLYDAIRINWEKEHGSDD